MKREIISTLVAIAALSTAAIAEPFTYQGQLSDAGAPANGEYDIAFQIFDAAVGGAQIGSTVTQSDIVVIDGVFQTDLDFGDVFDGSDKWMRIYVRPGASAGAFTELLPRQAMTQTPEAQFAQVAETAMNAPWTVAPGIITYGDGNDSVFINRNYAISGADNFGVHGTSALFNGMYVSGPADSLPFYGYSADDNIDAYHYYNSTSNEWVLYSNGGERLRVDAAGDLVAQNDVEADAYRFSTPKTRYVSVSGNVLSSPTGEYSASGGTGGAWMTDPGFHWLVAPLEIPHGATVTGMTVYCGDTAVGSMTVRLSYQTHGGTGFNTMSVVDTAGFNSANLTLNGSTPFNNVIDHANRHYHIRVFSSSWPGNSTLRVSSVRIAYTIDEAN